MVHAMLAACARARPRVDRDAARAPTRLGV